MNTFYNKFDYYENISKYFLIYSLTYQLIYRDNEIIERMKFLDNINKLSNLLLKKYYFKINRKEAKYKRLIGELPEIENFYNSVSFLMNNLPNDIAVSDIENELGVTQGYIARTCNSKHTSKRMSIDNAISFANIFNISWTDQYA
jgi:hypothetical protein